MSPLAQGLGHGAHTPVREEEVQIKKEKFKVIFLFWIGGEVLLNCCSFISGLSTPQPWPRPSVYDRYSTYH